MALLAAGVLAQGVGALAGVESVSATGVALSCLGALGYGYLLARRFRG